MNIYQSYTNEQIDELLSNFLIDTWSYSKVSTFSRNEKEFEMRYIYNEKSKSSSSTIAGQAYHKSLELYFRQLMAGNAVDVVDMQSEAFDHINSQSASVWKTSKTRPAVQDCINAAVEASNKGINNFLTEVDTYLSNIKEVLDVELRLKTFVNINGVDIPLPCDLAIDLVARTNEDKIAIIDHKLRTAFTNDDDIRFTVGKQAITYVKGYESKFSDKVDEVWFVENKISKNKDNSSQLALHKISMDDDTRRLYEATLYEPLRRMISAVSDPDYVYLINDNDNLTDKATLYEFWAKTMIAEIDGFNITENKKPLIEKRLKKIRDASLSTATPTVLKNFKKYAQQFISYDLSNKDMTNQEKIEHVLRAFGIITKVQHSFDGYSSSSYLLEINSGTSISNVNKYRLDIANALDVPNVRIHKDLFVYNGKSYLAIESGKKSSDVLIWDKSILSGNKIPIGVDNFQQTIIWDLDNHSTPHMLICGATGSGKSVSLNSTISYALEAGVENIYIFDPKYEFTKYKSHPNIVVENEIEGIELQMETLVSLMEERVKKGHSEKTLIVFDEFADAVANSKKGKELDIIELVQDGFYAPKKIKGVFGECTSDPVPRMKHKVTGRKKTLEENLRILLQKGRSSGFRIIAATQRASTKVITGDAKVNFPVQICFRVPKDIDSIVVIDEPGAESLNGRGDGLMKSPEYLGIVRFQAFYKEDK